MQDFFPKGTGNSRYLKSSIAADTTLEQLITMLRNGTFPFDFNGINADGVAQMGTPYNTANVLPASVASLYGRDSSAVLKDVLEKLSNAIAITEHTPDVETYEDVQVGNAVYINIDGTPTEFIVVHQGKPSEDYDDSCNGTWLMMKNIYALGRWGAKTSPPHYWSTTINDYLNETFYNKIDPSIREYIKTVNIPVENITFTAKVFALSASEIGGSKADSEWLGYEEGAKLDYFISGSTSQAKSKRIAAYNAANESWLLRSIDNNGTYANPYIVSSDGSYTNSTDNVNRGYRPVFIFPFKSNLLTDIFVNQKNEDITEQVKSIVAASKIEIGSYTGTGTYGQNNPNSLTFGFEPKIVLLYRSQQFLGANYGSLFCVKPDTLSSSASSGSPENNLTWTGSGLSWWNRSSGDEQMNNLGTKYYYIAVG